MILKRNARFTDVSFTTVLKLTSGSNSIYNKSRGDSKELWRRLREYRIDWKIDLNCRQP